MSENATATDARTESSDGQADETEGAVWSRRSFVRYLAPISFAVPVVVEGRTFVGLLQQDLRGERSYWRQPTGTLVGIGGELRPDTPTREKLADASLTDVADGRHLVLQAAVKNTGQSSYRFALGSVTTDGGDTVSGGTRTDRVPPGETATLEATYDLPAEATPRSVETTVTIGSDASAKTVDLAPIPGPRP